MSVKVFYISGHYKKGKRKINFGKYIRALSLDDAIEELSAILGSKHHVKRNEIFVYNDKVREITDPNEIKDIYVHAFTTDDNLTIPPKM